MLNRVIFLISLLFVIILIMIGVKTFFTKEVEKSSSSQEKSLKNYFLIESNYHDGYLENYAGSYIDENQILHINIVGDDIKPYRNIVKMDEVIYHNVMYPLRELENIVNTLNKDMAENNIASISIDVKINRVIIYLRNYDNINIEKIKEINNSPAIIFKKLENEIYEK